MPMNTNSGKMNTSLPDYREEKGLLPDGTEYLIRVPTEWSGVLIRDLDFAMGAVNPERKDRYLDMLSRGYAVAGTARHRLRQWQYDPLREIANLDRVLDRFEARWGSPGTVLQYGCSGGGHMALTVSESFCERVHGSIALAAHTPVWLMNCFLDGWFALKVLLAEYYEGAGYGPKSDLSIVSLPNDGSSHPTGHGMEGKLPEAWRRAFRAAQACPEGRARIALAFTLGQWPAWMADGTSLPEQTDTDALQAAMFESALRLAQSPGGEARIMFENAAQGQQLSWNDDVDYVEFFENGNAALKRATEELYGKTTIELDDDLRRINDAPRIEVSSYALEFWSQPGRTIFGRPKIPVIRLHMVGDYQIPYTLVQGYMDTVMKNGCSDLVRTAFVHSTGHCNFSTAESATAVEAMLQKLRTGAWPDTNPESLNALGDSLKTYSAPRFMSTDSYELPRFNRTWIA
ncbi:MAG: hypothetical protein JJ959_06995 [Nisaea sp.]|uniref:hypothetical protein n=1 Tax=Nisaea sp. TaxID=2024842 RepID=UPI001B11CD8B|nr:hypothetical protein [Nisaea sp.]MBO6560266.1 hypothetical protein [Nisaea sp.]